MGADIYETVLNTFPGCEFVKMDNTMESLCGIKTAAELEVIRYAYHLANLGMEAAVNAVRPGVSEREIAAEAEYVMRKNGSEGTGIGVGLQQFLPVNSSVNEMYPMSRTILKFRG